MPASLVFFVSMSSRPKIAIVGAGNLGTALALSLRDAGYVIDEIMGRQDAKSLARARKLAAQLGTRRSGAVNVSSIRNPLLAAEVVWLCVPDREIAPCAELLARVPVWRGKIALHSSGALTSSELGPLKQKGATVASVHPLMTFVKAVRPSLRGVPFGLEGDTKAVRAARRIVHDLGGDPFSISKKHKPAYHAWGGFTSPLLVSALVAGERVAMQAGMTPILARRRMAKIVQQTLSNYLEKGPADSFSGPIVRGDANTIEKHLNILSEIPEVKSVYLALARAALQYLPGKNKGQLSKLLKE